MPFNEENLSRLIRELRLDRKMTQAELGQRMGLKNSIISDWEKGKRTPSMRQIQMLANIFNVSIETMIGSGTSRYRSFPQRLSDIITYRHLTYDEVAEAIDVEPDDIDRMVAGDLEPTYDQFKALAEYLNVTEDCLEGKTEYDIVERGTGDDDDAVWTLREQLRRDPDRRTLFNLARNGTAQDVRQAVALIDALRATNPDFYDGDDPS